MRTYKLLRSHKDEITGISCSEWDAISLATVNLMFKGMLDAKEWKKQLGWLYREKGKVDIRAKF